MKYGKREYRLPKTENRQETEKAESGQVSWVLGLFLILFLAILLYMQLQLAMYKASARYLEDALALSNLASAVIDIRGARRRTPDTRPVDYERMAGAVPRSDLKQR